MGLLRSIATSICLTTVLILLVLSVSNCSSNAAKPEALRVAHAGGAVTGQFGSNSLGAMTESFDHGFRYIELDLILTSDDKVVCLRNWGEDIEKVLGFKPDRALSYETFLALQRETVPENLKRCHQDNMIKWLAEHPSAKLVIDFKSNNLRGMSVIRDHFPINQIIPQVHTWSDFELAKSEGYDAIIWTLYRSKPDDVEVLNTARADKRLLAVTMPYDRAYSGLPAKLARKRIKTYAHTVNDRAEFSKLIDYGITEIYTDALVP